MVPSAGAVLADWGAAVIKVEPPGGDPQRDIGRRLSSADGAEPAFDPMFQSVNRGKRSVVLDLRRADSRPVMERLIASSDVFLTSVRPATRRELRLDARTVRAVNPAIVYATGSGHGRSGEDSGKAGFDATAYWARGGGSAGSTPPGADYPAYMSSGGFGDVTAGLAIAGGVAAALFARVDGGRGGDLDVSLLASGAWVNQLQVNAALSRGGSTPVRDPRAMMPGNPLVRCYRTADARWIQLTVLRPARAWGDFCRRIGRGDLLDDPRFADMDRIGAHHDEAVAELTATFAARALAAWTDRLRGFDEAWRSGPRRVGGRQRRRPGCQWPRRRHRGRGGHRPADRRQSRRLRRAPRADSAGSAPGGAYR